MKNILAKIDTNNLHHGYIIVGDREVSKELLFELLEKVLKIETTANPDFSYTEFNTVSIDDARALTESQSRKDFGKNDKTNKKIFVIAANIITDEAQNALLKVFEEPTEGTHFFLLVSQNTFLPTFLSRLQVIQLQNRSNDIESILKKSLPERLALVTKLAGDISDEKNVKQDAINLVNQIESELNSEGVENNLNALRECQFARNALFSRGAMIKIILENLMLQI